MSAEIPTFKNGKRHFILDSSIPDIDRPNPQLIRSVNSSFSIPFPYTGSVLLDPQGQILARALRDSAGRCLGGGVLASRDLEWLASGANGNPPGDYVPKKSLFGSSKEPQSAMPSEWAAFEWALMLRGPYGSPFISPWDEVNGIVIVRKQGRDIHVRIDGTFGGWTGQIFAQANSANLTTLVKIAGLTGVPTYA